MKRWYDLGTTHIWQWDEETLTGCWLNRRSGALYGPSGHTMNSFPMEYFRACEILNPPWDPWLQLPDGL